MARIDSVFADRDGDIFVVKGTPVTSIENAKIPENPAYALRLNNLVVMPYPNVPINYSTTLAEILERNIANETFSNVRAKNRTIAAPITETEIEQEQPVGYTMEDIGNLDRRVKDLEYYVSLSLLESDMKDRVIPSSIDPTLARFKYGFFVDDFTTKNYSEEDHKTYSAAIENDDVIPNKEIITLSNPLPVISQGYIEYPVVTQLNATGEADEIATVVAANTWAVRKEPSKKKDDTFTFTMGSFSGPVILYGHFYSGSDSISVYQGNTLLRVSNSTFLQNLTAINKTLLKSPAVPGKWFKDVRFVDFSVATKDGLPSVKNSFKFTWTHNPAAGTTYTIKVKNQSIVWRYAINYPINSTMITDAPTAVAGSVKYTGRMIVTPNKIDIVYKE